MSSNTRSGKFYYENEREVLEYLGFRQVAGSGNGWIAKEDGESENFLCQLKSTNANSIRINKLDIEKLQYHAVVSHKSPIFAINFLSDNSVYILMQPQDIIDFADFLKTGIAFGKGRDDFSDLANVGSSTPLAANRIISSASDAREKYNSERNKLFERRGRSAT